MFNLSPEFLLGKMDNPYEYEITKDELETILRENSPWRERLREGFVPRFVWQHLTEASRECLRKVLQAETVHHSSLPSHRYSEMSLPPLSVSFRPSMTTPVFDPPLAAYLLALVHKDEERVEEEAQRREDEAFKTDMLTMSEQTLETIAVTVGDGHDDDETFQTHTPANVARCVMRFLWPQREAWKAEFLSWLEHEQPKNIVWLEDLQQNIEEWQPRIDTAMMIDDKSNKFINDPKSAVSFVMHTASRLCFKTAITPSKIGMPIVSRFSHILSRPECSLLMSADNNMTDAVYAALTDTIINVPPWTWTYSYFESILKNYTQTLLTCRNASECSNASCAFVDTWCDSMLRPQLRKYFYNIFIIETAVCVRSQVDSAAATTMWNDLFSFLRGRRESIVPIIRRPGSILRYEEITIEIYDEKREELLSAISSAKNDGKTKSLLEEAFAALFT